jgi:uncharacterized protein (TIGR02678 family)
MRVAADVSGFELAEYQKAVRLVLRHPLITPTYPDERALPAVRRWSAQLRADLAEAFGYRLELHGDTVRLLRVADELDPSQPATSRTGKTFDRRRYAYCALILAALGRAGIQVTLTELADAVRADAGRIPGLGFAADSYAHRMAFVDAVLFLEQRGALRLADGAPTAWASDPERAEALYDIDRDVLVAVFRPARVLQHVRSVEALLDRAGGTSENARRRAAGQAARRAVAERSAVYYAQVPAEVANHLRAPALTEDLERLTGLRVERRAEGVALIDTAGWSEHRFPGTGVVAQTALLLAGEIADRIEDVDAEPLPRLPVPRAAERRAALAALVDAGLPAGGVLAQAAGEAGATGEAGAAEGAGAAEVAGAAEGAGAAPADTQYPLLVQSWLRSTVDAILDRYGAAFGERWLTDPGRLLAEAVAVLAMHRLVAPVPGGVLALPLLGRYRIVTATVRRRGAAPALFDVEGLG